jgi:cation diffusion facilitator CzcD-associated flavoprotein CzcO
VLTEEAAEAAAEEASEEESEEESEVSLDVLLFATGFAVDNCIPSGLVVRGRGGATLADAWRERAEAYLGLTVPGFPNLWVLYGPNTNTIAGSITHFRLE